MIWQWYGYGNGYGYSHVHNWQWYGNFKNSIVDQWPAMHKLPAINQWPSIDQWPALVQWPSIDQMASPWPMTSYELLNSTNTTNHLPLKTNNRLSFWKFIGLVGVSSKVASLSMYSMDFLVLHGIKRNPWNPWDPWDPWTPWSPGNPWDPWNPGTRPCPILIRGQAWYAYFRWVPCGLIFHQNRFFKTVFSP